MKKVLAKTRFFSTTIAVPVIYSLLFGVVTISPAQAEDFPRLDEAIPRGSVTSVFAPVFDFDEDGCLPSCGISRSGTQNAGSSTSWTGSWEDKRSGCRDRNFLLTSNTLHRYACISSGGSTYCGHFYALYFKKDQTGFPASLFDSGHRHDWEYAAIWTKDGKITGVSRSAHGDLALRAASDVLHEDGHPKIVYHSDGILTHAMRFAGTGDTAAENPYHVWVTPTITTWYELTGDGLSNQEMRHKLNTFDYGSGTIPLKDDRFLTNLNRFKPSSYSEFTEESVWTSNLSNPVLTFIDGDGSFFGEGSDYVLDFGTISVGTDSVLSAELAVGNLVFEPADTLDGFFDTVGAAPFELTGFDEFFGLEWGNFRDGLLVETPTEGLGLGVVTGMVEFIPAGQIDSGFRVPWDDPITLTLRLEMVPEPAAGLILLFGTIAMLFRREVVVS